MRRSIYNLDGEKAGEVELPVAFGTAVMPKLIRRVFWALFTHGLQPKGTDPMAGKRTSAESWGVGRGVSRIARVKGNRYTRAGQAAGVASVVGGRRAHPPKVEKAFRKEVNRKERRLATASAIAAAAVKEIVRSRGHRVDGVPEIPLVVVDDLESISRSGELRRVFMKLGLWEDVERAADRSPRGGRARWRGRARRSGSGPLIVVGEDRGVSKAARNIPGVDVVLAKDISVLHLAPGGHPGRLSVWTVSALKGIPGTIDEVATAHGL